MGAPTTLAAIRAALAQRPSAGARRRPATLPDAERIADSGAASLDRAATPSLRPVFNLTGTVLHTNLGRARLAEAAAEAARRRRCARRSRSNSISPPAGAASATTICAACCASSPAPRTPPSSTTTPPRCCWCSTRFAQGREAIVSRGELIEIGGAFRCPRSWRRAGARLVEVGTTNRTHLQRLRRRRSAPRPAWCSRSTPRTTASRASPPRCAPRDARRAGARARRAAGA